MSILRPFALSDKQAAGVKTEDERPDEETSGDPIVVEADDDPHRLARIVFEDYQTEDGPRLRFWRDEWYIWQRGAFQPFPLSDLRARLSERIKEELNEANHRALLAWARNGGEGKRPVARKVTGRLVSDVVHALAGMAIVSASVEMPSWLEGKEPFPAHEVLACHNTLLHLPSWADGQPCQHRPTPRFFSRNALDFDFDPNACPSRQWLGFLNRCWERDLEAIGTLQETAGYLLLPETILQKIFMLIGPKRSGKGTIARVFRRLIGELNVCTPTLASLGTNFGLSPLLGKALAVISDARLSGRTDLAVVVERLLSISGEDAQTVDRKHLAPVTTKLLTRFLILTNELPRLNDASGALAGRLVLLRMTRSWYGKEDPHLTGRLLTELPGILLWALEGWKRLRQRGRFIQPASSAKFVRDLENLSSPVGAFIRERCVVEPGAEVAMAELYREWRCWCEAKGRKDPGTEHVFGRDLRAVHPGIDDAQRRLPGGARIRVYVGIRLRSPQEPVMEEPAMEDDVPQEED